jgi:Ran GTPase-activating protein (RanGAP) involved in mRNA processing and transport
MKGSCIGRRGAEYLAAALKGSQIQHLGLGRCGLDFTSATSILKSLRGTPIQTLDLEWNGLQDGVAPLLADLIANNDSLLSLNLERNEFRTEGVAAFAKALSQPTACLCNLNLAFNRCSPQACRALGEALAENKRLLTINLMQAAIVLDGAKHIVAGIAGNETLKCLNLQGNQAIDAFAGANVKYPSSLQELNLAGNRISNHLIEPFADKLQTAKSLVALSLEKCQFGEPGVRKVIQGVEELTRLVTVDLGGCLISHTSGDLLAEMCKRCPNINALYLDDNVIGRFGAEALACGIESAPSLTVLSLNRCQIGKEGMGHIGSALQKREGLALCELHVAGNGLGYEGCLFLCAALCAEHRLGPELRALDLSDNGIGGRCCAFLASVLRTHARSLVSITIRGNPLAEETRQNYLTFEGAVAYTGGLVSDPSVRPKEDVQEGSAERKAPSFHERRAQVTNRRSNFHGTTNQQEACPVERSLDELNNTTRATGMQSVAVCAASGPITGISTQRNFSTSADPYEPGLSPSVPPFKKRHDLHAVEENVNLLPITETQLRSKFLLLDDAGDGRVAVERFLEFYRSFDVVPIESPTSPAERLVTKMCPSGFVTFQEFCVLMLKLVHY